MISLQVIDRKTGEEANEHIIARKARRGWASDLMVDDIEGWAIAMDGKLLLTDECGRYVYAPEGRFEVRILRAGTDEVIHTWTP